MKKILMLVVAIAASYMADAQIRVLPFHDNAIQATSITEQATHCVFIKDAYNDVFNGKAANTLFGNQRGDSAVNASNGSFVAYNGQYSLDGFYQTPVAYEPYSKMLYTYMDGRRAIFDSTKTPPVLYVDSVIVTSTIASSSDYGLTWKVDTVSYRRQYENYMQDTFSLRRFPSIAVANPSKSTSADSVLISYRNMTSRLTQVGDKTMELDGIIGVTSGARMKNIKYEDKASESDISTPWIGSDKMNKFTFRLLSYGVIDAANANKAHAVYYGRTEPPENTSTLMHYGIMNIPIDDAATGDASDMVEAGVGRNLMEIEPYIGNDGPDKFVKSACGIDYDNQGNIYLLTTNVLPATVQTDDKDRRTPVIFKSTIADMSNKSKTTSFVAIDSVPESLIVDYVKKNNGVIRGMDDWWYGGVGGGLYYTAPFVVTGEDAYSFVNVLVYFAPRTNPSTGKIDTANVLSVTEFAKANGIWKIRKVKDLQFFSIQGPKYNDANRSGAIWPPYTCKIDTMPGQPAKWAVWLNQDHNEVELAKTADGQYLVAKFLYTDTNKQVGFGKDSVTGEQITVDYYFTYFNSQDSKTDTCVSKADTSFPLSEIWVAYRHIHPDSAWKANIAVSSSDLNGHNTAMPKIVPNINNVPILFTHSRLSSNPTDTKEIYRNSVPKVIGQSCTIGAYQYGLAVLADATIKNTAWNSTTSITEKGESNTFSLDNVYPNPANGTVYFNFSLLTPANTVFTITNALGQTVAELVNEYCQAREYEVTFNTDNLAIGTYYYTLKSGTNTQTKMFNVVK